MKCRLTNVAIATGALVLGAGCAGSDVSSRSQSTGNAGSLQTTTTGGASGSPSPGSGGSS